MESRITGKTVLTGLIGSPVEHSISPMMHNEAFRILNLNYVYLAFDVNLPRLEKAVEGLRCLGVRGFNVTMPDKNQICGMMDELSPEARIGGAVNTVLNHDGKLKGFTTDGKGFATAVETDGVNIAGSKMTILGAGGAGTSILIQSALDGASEINIFNSKSSFYYRTKNIIDQLKNETKCRIHLFDYSDEKKFEKEIRDSSILVNATPVGMAPETEKCLIKNDSVFHPELYVFDAIYEPRQTMLLKKAEKCGCRTANGLNMLLYQGAEAFKIWTGKDMPVDLIKNKIFNK